MDVIYSTEYMTTTKLLNHFFVRDPFESLVKSMTPSQRNVFNPLNAELNPICHLLALLDHHILHVGRISVKCIK